jgi:kynurenine formamidase
VGHISKERITIHQSLLAFHFTTQVVSIRPQEIKDDHIITLDDLPELMPGIEALVIRTLPNTSRKYHRRYSGTNPPYLSEEVAVAIREHGIQHLIVDLPSVDREEDGGELKAHHAFWNYPAKSRANCTITELAVIPNEAKDGLYLLNLQIAAFESDASPSKPILFPLTPA